MICGSSISCGNLKMSIGPVPIKSIQSEALRAFWARSGTGYSTIHSRNLRPGVVARIDFPEGPP
jgi:hypothetical protein